MKAIIEFDLHEERQEFQDCTNGWKWKCIVSEIDNELRTRTKYASDETPDEVVDALIKVRDFIRELLIEEGLTI